MCRDELQILCIFFCETLFKETRGLSQGSVPSEGRVQNMNAADTMADLRQAVAIILAKRAVVPRQQSILIGITGIDGSGKGYLTNQIQVSEADKSL
jgi:putative protein kinase ArgK-like GTPase of G3E family